jgi:hypothetical protein
MNVHLLKTQIIFLLDFLPQLVSEFGFQDLRRTSMNEGRKKERKKKLDTFIGVIVCSS